MSNNNGSKNVVDLQQRQSTSAVVTDRLGELLKSVRATALKRVNGLVGTLFENIDDALFDLAEKAQNNSLQVQYFDGMREVRKKRQLVERLFQEQLSKIFNDFAAGKLQPIKPEVNAQQGNNGLTLVDDQDLEESLAVASTVAKAENRLARPLFAVNQRLSVILGGVKVEDATNPIAPAPLCHAFRLAMHEFDVNVQVKLIIYKLFDRFVMAGLDQLYEEVNTQLIHAGVLPQIRRAPSPSTQRMSGTGNALPPGAPASIDPDTASMHDAAFGYAAQQGYDTTAAQLQAELYNTLQSLLANRRTLVTGSERQDYLTGTANSGVMVAPNFSPTELMSALTILQNQATMAQTHASTAADVASAAQQIKQELIEQVNKFHGDQKAHVSGADEDTIDLVSMLFEFILQDRNLPAQIQALLGRLQIPFLKVAILDKHLFAQKTHPARQLLDSMARASIGWSEESDRDNRLYDKIKQTVELLLHEFDDDLSIFERIRKDFDSFVENNSKRAELAEQRAAEATRGREKLHTARRLAAREILKRIENKQLPEIVHNVLTRPWANYLVLTLLRQGEDSDEWKQALHFADEFVWSAEPKSNDADKTRLKGLLPGLEKNLRQGLTTVAYHENDVKQLMQELHGFYQRVLNDEIPRSDKPTTRIDKTAGEAVSDVSRSVLSPATTTSSQIEEIVLSSVADEDSVSEANYEADDEYFKQAKEMTVGTWVEFTDPNTGTKERAKLSWISPISSKYLFVNRKGLKVADKTVFALSNEMRRGEAIVLEEVPLFDRALDAIVERLKATHVGDTENPHQLESSPS